MLSLHGGVCLGGMIILSAHKSISITVFVSFSIM